MLYVRRCLPLLVVLFAAAAGHPADHDDHVSKPDPPLAESKDDHDDHDDHGSEPTCASWCERQKRLVAGNTCIKFPKGCGGCRFCVGRDVPQQSCPKWCDKYPDGCYKFDQCKRCPDGCTKPYTPGETVEDIKAVVAAGCPSYCTSSDFFLKRCSGMVECQKCYKCFKGKFFHKTVAASKEMSEMYYTGGPVSSGIHISVKLPSKKVLTLFVKRTFKISYLKYLLKKKEGFMTDYQSLFKASEELEDGKMLLDYGIKNEAKLRLVMKTGEPMTVIVQRMNWQSSTLMKTTREYDEEEFMKRMDWEDRGLIGEKFTLEVRPFQTVGEVKKQILQRDGFPVEEQKIFCGTCGFPNGFKSLVDGNMLSDYDVKDGTKLHLVLHLAHDSHINHPTQTNIRNPSWTESGNHPHGKVLRI